VNSTSPVVAVTGEFPTTVIDPVDALVLAAVTLTPV
jgi:glutamate/tyrosine decarboxylase-like PLP-dependent enzyme